MRHGAVAEATSTRPQAAPASLLVEHVSPSFGGVAALRDVSLAVAPGEIRAVIGPNGAGKSSLLNVVSGLYAPQSGRMVIDGAAFAAVPAARLARLGVARTVQNPALFGSLSAADNVAAGVASRSSAGVAAQVLGLPRARADRREAAARTAQAIAFFHLEPYAARPAATLPYGIQKLVELARTMVGVERARADLTKLESEVRRLQALIAATQQRIAKIKAYIEIAQIYDAEQADGSADRATRGGVSGAVIRASIDLVRQRGKRIHTHPLLADLAAQGIHVGGSNPAANLSGLLSRSDELNSNRALGWGLSEWGDAPGPTATELLIETTSNDPLSSHEGEHENDEDLDHASQASYIFLLNRFAAVSFAICVRRSAVIPAARDAALFLPIAAAPASFPSSTSSRIWPVAISPIIFARAMGSRGRGVRLSAMGADYTSTHNGAVATRL